MSAALGLEHLTPGPPKSQHPPTVYCYICGRQFGTASIGIHQPQCLKKWRWENDKLPKSQRRPEPTPPKVVFDGSGKVDYAATNQAAYEASLAQLVRCDYCGRKFSPDRLKIHHKSCTRDNPAAKVGSLKVHRDVKLATTEKAREVEEEREKEEAATGKKKGHGRNGQRPQTQWRD